MIKMQTSETFLKMMKMQNKIFLKMMKMQNKMQNKEIFLNMMKMQNKEIFLNMMKMQNKEIFYLISCHLFKDGGGGYTRFLGVMTSFRRKWHNSTTINQRG